MKYLKRKDLYINEAFDMSGNTSGPLGNDINWGDSLVGRMFNSIARRFTVNYNVNKIENIAKDIEQEFENLLASGAIRESGEDEEFKFFKISFLLGKLKEIIDNEESVVKIKENVESLADYISEMPDFKSDKAGIKKELEDSLSHFEDFLKNIKDKPNDGETDNDVKSKEDEAQDEDNETQDKLDIDYDEVVKLLRVTANILSKAEKLRKKYKDIPKIPNVDANNPDKSERLPEDVRLFLELDKHLVSLLSDEDGFKLDKDLLEDLLKEADREKSRGLLSSFVRSLKMFAKKAINLKKLIKESNDDDGKYDKRGEALARKIVNFAKDIMDIDSKEIDGDLGDYIEDFNNSFKKVLSSKIELKSENKLFKYNDFIKIYEKSNSGKEIQEFFYKNITLDNWVVDENRADEIKDTVENSTKDVDKVDIDPILSIVKLFNKAFKVYTTQTIPSGRTSGRVSDRVFRRYTNIGSGNGTPQSPGNGPFIINKVFNKFEDKIQDIIKEEKYKILFNKDTEIVVGDGREIKGGGKILLKFIQSLLDGGKLYKGNAQSKFFQEYFGIEISPKKIGSDISDFKDGDKDSDGNPSNPKDSKGEPDENKEPIKARFEEVKEITDTLGTVYGILLGKEKMYYLMVLMEEDDYIYIKYSETFLNFAKYMEDDYIINKGVIKDVNTKPKEVYFGRINKELFDIESGDDLEIYYIDLNLFNINNEQVKPLKTSNIKNIRNIFQLIRDDEDPVTFTDIDESSFGPMDSKNYKDLKAKFN